jgi:hypothetical protein
MTPELLKTIQDALQAQFQAGYAAARLDMALAAALPKPAEPEPAPPPQKAKQPA